MTGSIWGKVVCGLAGFVMGGPAGAMFGAFAGHAVDRANDAGLFERLLPPMPDTPPQVSFTGAFIVVAAKMAGAEAGSSQLRLAAFHRLFQVSPCETRRIVPLFEQARRDPSDMQPYAKVLAEMFADSRQTREEVLEALVIMGQSDGPLTSTEIERLLRVAVVLDLDPATVRRLQARHQPPPPPAPDAYAVLGVSRASPADQIKAAYRRLIRDTHPDALMAQGKPHDLIDAATRKMATINTAYDSIRKERGFT